MMYTREQVRIARENLKERRECPKWLQQMFFEAPMGHTLSKCCSTWDGGFTGDSEHLVYRISDEWPPESEILPDTIIELESPTRMLVSDNGNAWFERDVIGRLGDQFLVILRNNRYSWWRYAKELTEKQTFAVEVTIERLISSPANEHAVQTAVEFALQDHISGKNTVTVKEL